MSLLIYILSKHVHLCLPFSYRVISMESSLSFISRPLNEKLDERAPSILNTTASVCGGRTNKLLLVIV